ncbi:MAG: chemotaxis protein CheW [Planctomycetota bacterium]|nr:chemotaxis protein CheW [Planctomycetota bacterium]
MSASVQNATGTTQASGGRAGGEQLQLVSFEVGGEEFAVDILAVQEINRMLELTRVPQSPPEVEGVINLRGKIIPVLDLRKRFGMLVSDRSEHNRIVVVEVNHRVLGFIVDRVHEVLRIGSDIVEPAPPMVCSIDSEFISGVAKFNDRLIILLDLARLFAAQAGTNEAHSSAHAA